MALKYKVKHPLRFSAFILHCLVLFRLCRSCFLDSFSDSLLLALKANALGTKKEYLDF